MASASVPSTPSSLSRPPPASSAPQDRSTRLSFPLALQTKPFKGVRASACNGNAFVRKAHLSEVVGGDSNDTAAVLSKSEEEEEEDVGKEAPLAAVQMSPEAISEFMNQVSSLVRLVDSKDVVELQLKQPGCELIIRKKEALQEPPRPPQVMMMPAQTPPQIAPSAYSAPPTVPAPVQAAPAPSAPAPAKLPGSSHPPLKSPMSGTFYRSPAPGEPPFVKIGDRVRTGQVLCIIEAMKLMNEIEADHDGTVVEIFIDDGKPVGVGQPMFVIKP